MTDPNLHLTPDMTDEEVDEAVAEAEAIDGIGRWHFVSPGTASLCGAEYVLTTGDVDRVSCQRCKTIMGFEVEEDEVDPALAPFNRLVSAFGTDVEDFLEVVTGENDDALLLILMSDGSALGVADYTDEFWSVVLYADKDNREDDWLDVTDRIGRVIVGSPGDQEEVGRRLNNYLSVGTYAADKASLAKPEERTYLVGLPVAVTVHDDGWVHLSVDAGELTTKLLFEDLEQDLTDEEVEADANRIEVAFTAKTITTNTMHQEG